MSKQIFPHLQDSTSFPGNNGQPYSQYPNDFDYSRWGVGTKLTVCRVPWDLDQNVVDWKSNDDVINYFHSLDSSSSFKLESEINREPDGSIRLPIPISNLKKYNYLFVEYTVPTSPEQPLEYASGERQPFIGFFMSDFTYVAPSTTEAALVTDWWTTSITSMEIQNMILERGHAPMAATKVDEYLKDPIHNNRYLLTQDVSFGEPCITTAAQFESWMATTEPLMVLAVKATLEQAQAMLAEKEVGGKNTPPTFSDSPERWGKEYQVNGYSWDGVSPFKDATVESTPWSTATGLPAGVSMIAVKATQAQAFLNYCQSNSPELFEVVQSCFLIPGSLVASKEAGTYGGAQLFELKPLEELPPVPVKLEKEDFDYPEEYEKIAKLYTFPYAGLTFSDNAGHSVDVRIEYTSSVQIHRRVSLAYPYLRAQAFLSGVNGTGDTSYEWVDASGLKRTGSMPQADWTQTLMEYEIPTYALAQTAISQALLKNSTPAAIERLKALTAYQNGARALNTSTENTRDSLATSLKNTLRSNETALENGTRSNETGNTNTLASLTTGNTNTLASNQLALDNGNRSNETGNTNAIASIENSFNNTNASLDTERHNSLRSNETGYKNTLASADTGYSNEKASAATTLSNTTASAGTAYQNAENSTNTAYQNTKNSADTGLANTLASNATAKANGDRSNNTSTANTMADASTGLTNANRSADAARTAVTNSVNASNDQLAARNQNADETYSINKAKMWSTNNQNISLQRKIMGPLVPSIKLNDFGIPYSFEETDHPGPWWAAGGKLFTTKSWSVSDVDGQKMRDLVDHSDTQTLLLTKSNQANWYTSQIAQVQGIQGAATSMIESVASAASIQNPAAGNYAAPIGAAIGTARTLANTALTPDFAKAQWLYNTNETFYDLAQNYATMEKQIAYSEAMNGGKDENGKRSVNLEALYESKEQGKALDRSTTKRNNILASTNGDLAQATSKTNAAASNATTVANANRTSDTTSANLAATKTTADANANRSYNTTMTNAGNSKETALTNAENNKNRTVENAQASNSTTLANARRSNDLAHANAKRSSDTTIANIDSTYNTEKFINEFNRKTSTDNQARSYTTTKTNLAASKNVADANANRSYTTGTTNQGRSYTTTSTNLQASKTTADANANDANATSVANAGYSQAAGLLNSQAELKLKQDAYQMSIMNAQTSAPLTVGSNSGDPLPDLWGQRGVEIRVKTQPLGAIASAGSEMLRYGYQLGQAWHFEVWSVMKHFSYWKCSDLWLTPRSAFAELGKAEIRSIINNGVTVWRRPEEIGTVAVTDNWED